MSQPDFDGDMVATFLADDGVDVEEIEYYNAAGDDARTINAIIERNPPGAPVGDGGGLAPDLVVIVANDATNGIASTEINLGGDQLKLAVRHGKTAELREIAQIRRQDGGMLELEVN